MLEGLRVPTLLLTGGADMYTPPAALQLFVARIPGAASMVLPDVGHSAYWERPDAFNRAGARLRPPALTACHRPAAAAAPPPSSRIV